MTSEMKQSKFRIPPELLEYLKLQAAKNLRSVNAELIVRLAKSMEQDKEGRRSE
ncbi:Arc-like DNA binding domain protein [compost metagenome]